MSNWFIDAPDISLGDSQRPSWHRSTLTCSSSCVLVLIYRFFDRVLRGRGERRDSIHGAHANVVAKIPVDLNWIKYWVSHGGDISGAGRWRSSFVGQVDGQTACLAVLECASLIRLDYGFIVWAGLICTSLIHGGPLRSYWYITHLSWYADRIACTDPQRGLNLPNVCNIISAMCEQRYLCRNDISSKQNVSFHDRKHILPSLQNYNLFARVEVVFF